MFLGAANITDSNYADLLAVREALRIFKDYFFGRSVVGVTSSMMSSAEKVHRDCILYWRGERFVRYWI